MEGASRKSKNIMSGAERGASRLLQEPEDLRAKLQIILGYLTSSEEFFKLEDKIISGHILHAELLDMYRQPLNSKYAQSQI